MRTKPFEVKEERHDTLTLSNRGATDFSAHRCPGPFISTTRKNEHLLDVTATFSKKTKTIPMKGISATEVAKHFVSSWLFIYGPPAEVVANNGGCFTLKFFQDECIIWSIKKMFTTTYHPQTNGLVERYNGTILAALRT